MIDRTKKKQMMKCKGKWKNTLTEWIFYISAMLNHEFRQLFEMDGCVNHFVLFFVSELCN